MIQVATEATVHMGESREVLRLVNEARAQKGANPLIMSKELEQAAIDRGFELIILHGTCPPERLYVQ